MNKQVTVKVKKRNYQLSSQAQLATLEPTFWRDGYVISAWNTAPDGSGQPLISPVTFQNDITAYAQWMKATYYKYPIYNTAGDPTTGIKEWKSEYLDDTPYTLVQSSASRVTWNEGWYVVEGEVTIDGGAVCNGAVKLVLTDGCKLKIQNVAENNAGIQVTGDSNSLAIYGQENNTGQVIATASSNAAGIGGNHHCSGQNITINGGKVTASSGLAGAGIGGGNIGGGKNLVINGGTVTATGGSYGSGIGGGAVGEGAHITINGGTVTAKSNGTFGGAAGIGSGGTDGLQTGYADGHDITINGGIVKATGESGKYADIGGGAGIGGGQYGSGYNITIRGGNVEATSGGTVVSGIGAGGEAEGGASNIKVSAILTVAAGTTSKPTVVTHYEGEDIAGKLSGQQYVIVF